MASKLGIRGSRLNPLTKAEIEAIAFDTVGVLIKAEFQYAEAITITDYDKEMELIFGEHQEANYGHDIVEDIFTEAGTANAIIKTIIGNAASAIDAIAANATINDRNGTPAATLKIEAAFKKKLRYGVSGKRIGITTTYGTRESTTVATAGAGIGVDIIPVNGIGDIQIGDLVDLNAVERRKVIAIDEGNSTIQVDAVLGTALVSNDPVNVKGMQLHTWYKTSRGIESEVETELGKVYCSLDPSCQKYYIENVHAENQYLMPTDLSSASTYENRYPNDITTVQYLTGGSNGTITLTVDNIKFSHSAFDALSPQVLLNPETTNSDYFKELMSYSNNRSKKDYPVVVVTPDYNLTESGIIALGKKYLNSAIKPLLGAATWIGKPDQFNSDPNAPYRERPPVGAVAGAWIRKVASHGVHSIPAEKGDVLLSAYSVVGHNDFDDDARSRIYDVGFNIIQDRGGIRLRNFRTFNAHKLYIHGNSILVENYFRNSEVSFAEDMENEPNVAERVQIGADAIRSFLWNYWNVGSHGKGRPGESMGQYKKDDGSLSSFNDHYILESGPKLNTKDRLFTGEREYDLWVSVPTPTGTIILGVGLMSPGINS